jgi:hypothetical protein
MGNRLGRVRAQSPTDRCVTQKNVQSGSRDCTTKTCRRASSQSRGPARSRNEKSCSARRVGAPMTRAHLTKSATLTKSHGHKKMVCPTPSHNSNPSFHGCAIGRKTVGVLLRGRERKTIHGEWNNPQQAACAEPRLNIHVVYLADDEERKRGTEPRKVL